MELYVGLLRGINVSGHRIIKMAELKNSLSSMGLEKVNTYLQSGNIIFYSPKTNPEILAERIRLRILANFGHDISVLVYTKVTFQACFSNNPYAKDPSLNTKKMYFINLYAVADEQLFKAIKNDSKYPEELILSKNTIYVYYVNGYGKSKVVNNFFERKLQLIATARNYNTMKKLNDQLDELTL